MSWYEALEAGELTVRPSVDAAKRFGVSIDRMSVSASAGTPLAELLTAVEKSTADVIVLRYPARETAWFAALASGPRQALFADTVTCWALPVGKGRRPAPLAGFSTQLEADVDDDQVDDLVADVFGDSGNHYCSDPVFDRAKALAGRQEWARRRIADAGAVVLRGPDRRVLALAALDQQSSWTEIQLAGVVPAEQGRGRYGHLLAAVEDACKTRRLVVTAQAHQTGIQRIWSRYGFEPVHNLMTVHLVAAT
ncbi:GNAT superfamily N-acetyltransferase [Kribbella aluminosa]|uniref:GNAT superfamily N-acetyltransferase n=1 Tax=Kribbella aluminosa TaxID=416017 RepID=A0ABS4URU4_9ACTN|nr:N-acetyltransferase [Kribbella aluminosa]MBP2354364.1 GNAT superfamily N-acetyltransferase [Kribbella aluminosa]